MEAKLAEVAGYIIPPETEEFIREAIEDGTYEKHQRTLIDEYVKPHHRVLEGGAGLGIATEELSVRAQIVFSCEPNPTMNHCANKNAPEALILQRMLTARERVDLREHLPDTGAAFHAQPTRVVLPLNPNQAIPGYDLNCLVLDIEGEEGHLLNNLEPETLASLEMVIVELHPTMVQAEDLKRGLEELGYAGFEKLEDIEDRNVRHQVWRRSA